MKTIIEEGHTYEVRCKNCNCLFRYSADDLHRDSGLFKTKYYVFCPQCSADCKQKDSKIIMRCRGNG